MNHDASLQFEYPDERRARVVERAVRIEAGDIDDDRSQTTVDRNERTVEIRVHAADLVALRAALNTWTRMVGVAEDVAAHCE